MALFSHSESAYITSFLSAVDLDSSISPDGSVDPGVADRVPHLQGREALAKATKDLMALDVPLSSSQPTAQGTPTVAQLPPQSSGPKYWPSIPTTEPPPSLSSAAHRLGTSGVRSSSPANYLPHGFSPPSDPPRSAQQFDHPGASASSIFASQLLDGHVQIAPLRGFDPPPSSSGFTLPPISTTSLPNGAGDSSSRPSAVPSSASAPSVLASTTPTNSTSMKRPLPASSQPATDPSSAKRHRPSPSNPSPSSTPRVSDADSAKPRRPASTNQTKSASAVASQSGASQSQSAAGSATTGGASKGALLSPSQKRANHIQSEQKRRANIRRGYEALCEVVPALREAIRAEEEHERARELELYEDAGVAMAVANAKGKARGAGGAAAEKGKKKKKGARAEGADKPDGRAGPRSENVVLQKTIDYITDLIAERSALLQRLELARGVLPLGHPALPVNPQHLDATGVPLWEREWNGGMDLEATGPAGGGDDEGSEDEG